MQIDSYTFRTIEENGYDAELQSSGGKGYIVNYAIELKDDRRNVVPAIYYALPAWPNAVFIFR